MTAALSLIYIFAIITMNISVCLLLQRAYHGKTTYSFIGCQISLTLWLIAQLIQIHSESLRQLKLCYALGNAGICFFGSFWLIFAVSYLGREVPAGLTVSLFSLSSVFYAFAVSGSTLYYEKFTLDTISYGIVFYLCQAYIYLCLLAGFFLVLRRCYSSGERSRGQAASLALALLIPLTINLLTLNGIINLNFALTPLTLSISSILILLATYRYGFLNVNEVAFEDALNVIAEGLMVFNRRGEVTYFSSAAKRLLGTDGLNSLEELIAFVDKGAEASELESIETSIGGRTLTLKKSVCRGRKGMPTAYIVIISDITSLLERSALLAAAEQKLAIERERNRIAQEVHDTAGHTLTMISSLARLSLLPEATREKIDSYSSEIEALSRSGITQLRCSINNLRSDSFLTSVTNAVNTIADVVRDMTIDVCIQGTDGESFNKFARPIYDTCRELITNCERYSKADRMDIILKLNENSLALYVFDNGEGCEKIKPGNGLNGIIKRIEELDGTVRFISAPGEGFRTMIKIPVEGSEKN